MWRQDIVWLAQRVCSIAGPAVVGRVRDYRRTNRIELDVALAGQEIGLILGQGRTKATLPQGPRASISAIDVWNVPLSHRLHQRANAVGRLARNEQMDVIGHQYKRVQLATGSARVFLEANQVELMIVVLEKAGLAVVATLDNVHRHVRQAQAGASRHRVASMGLDDERNRIIKIVVCPQFKIIEQMFSQ